MRLGLQTNNADMGDTRPVLVKRKQSGL